MYDFTQCKLCQEPSAVPRYQLKKATLYHCPACDLHYIDHLDDLAEPLPAAALDDRTCQLIEARLVDNARLHRTRLRFVQRHTTPGNAQCLDIGSGVGFYPHLLAGEGAVVCGLEPSSVNRAFARHKFALTLEPYTLDRPDWLTEQRERFDQVTLWDVIEHVNFPRATLEAAFAVTKPGGWLFLDTPSRDSLYYKISEFIYRSSQGSNPFFLNSLYSSARFGHKQIFRPQQLAQLLRNVGYEVVTLKGMHDLELPFEGPFNTLFNAVAAPVRPKDKIIIACRKPAASAT